MPKKRISQYEADRRIRSLALQINLLKLVYHEIPYGDPLSINALLCGLGKLISVKWQKEFYTINEDQKRLEFVREAMLDCLKKLVWFSENTEDNRYILGDLYRTTLLAMMQNLLSCEIPNEQIAEIIN